MALNRMTPTKGIKICSYIRRKKKKRDSVGWDFDGDTGAGGVQVLINKCVKFIFFMSTYG